MTDQRKEGRKEGGGREERERGKRQRRQREGGGREREEGKEKERKGRRRRAVLLYYCVSLVRRVEKSGASTVSWTATVFQKSVEEPGKNSFLPVVC